MKFGPKTNQIFSEDSPRIVNSPEAMARLLLFFTFVLFIVFCSVKTPLTLKKKIVLFLSSKPWEYFLISLIILYCVLVFVSFGITDLDTDGSLSDVINILVYVELAILIIFTLEILANIYAYGFKFYFKDRWLFFDAIVIVASIALVIVDLSVDGTFNSISKIVRAIFRLLRIFLLFRKVNQFKKIKVTYSRYDVKSPVEKIIEILSNLKETFRTNPNKVQEIDWCIEIISSNRLYDPLLENLFKEDPEKQKEMINWISNYVIEGKKSTNKNENKKSGDAFNEALETPHRKETEIDCDFSMKNNHEMFKRVDFLDFNCFEFHEQSEKNGLVNLMYYLFDKHNLFEKLNIHKRYFINFAKKIQQGYLDNPYHNAIHAIDVTQSTHFMIKTCQFGEMAELSSWEIAAMYIASSVHDYEHPGTNNVFQISTKTFFAIRYNDKSVLENHHVSAAFINLQDPEHAIFSEFSRESYQKIRERIISMVLATDMASHFSDLAKIKGRLAVPDFDVKDKDKNVCMEEIIHACDISNPVKPFNIYSLWIERVLTEFWNQGDQERKLGIPITYLMDRYTVNTSKSQIGFIDVIVQPTFEVLRSFLPVLSEYIPNLDKNKEILKEKIEFYNENLKLLNEQREKEQNSKNAKDP